MLDISDINATIKYYEKQGTNLENCRILADLYTCKSYIENNYNNEETKELNDILPMYQEYCSVKREYQLGNIDKIKVVNSMKNVCKELKDFITLLYSCTDMQEERELLDSMLKSVM